MNKTWRKFVSMAKNPSAAERPLRYFDLFPCTSKLNILLVEDDEPDIYLISQALASNPRVGDVVVAEDGVKALELIDKGWVRPHLAIVDLHMPRKDGFALLRGFAASQNGGFPSVILTSSASKEDANRAMHCGAVEFITKPSTPLQLAAALERAIDNAVV
jgi:CheY-like chemotaxis protein